MTVAAKTAKARKAQAMASTAATAAERKAAQRARAVKAHRCMECCIGKPRAGLKSCDDCIESAKARVRKSREAAA